MTFYNGSLTTIGTAVIAKIHVYYKKKKKIK